MCYSAQVKQAYQEYVRMFGAEIDIREFVKLYASREIGAKVKTAKSMDDAFLRGGTPETREIAGLIASWHHSDQGKASRPVAHLRPTRPLQEVCDSQ